MGDCIELSRYASGVESGARLKRAGAGAWRDIADGSGNGWLIGNGRALCKMAALGLVAGQQGQACKR